MLQCAVGPLGTDETWPIGLGRVGRLDARAGEQLIKVDEHRLAGGLPRATLLDDLGEQRLDGELHLPQVGVPGCRVRPGL